MHASTIAAVCFAALAAAAPAKVPAGQLATTKRDVVDSYTYFSGNGHPSQGWPDFGSWGSFDELWNQNAPVMAQSCGWNGWGADNSPEEIANIRSAITQVAGEAAVDARWILATVMQESVGCVRAPTTWNGVVNPGLMQSHNGVGTCAGVNPCPQATILQMIRDGTSGTPSGDGLKQVLAKAASTIGDSGVRSIYVASRLYNSGSANTENLNDGIGATPCYVTDIANRLRGWILAPNACRA